jgi:hypothetical protein
MDACGEVKVRQQRTDAVMVVVLLLLIRYPHAVI